MTRLARAINLLTELGVVVKRHLLMSVRYFLRNVSFVCLLTAYVSYFGYLRSRYFIDRETGELHSVRFQRKVDAYILETCVYLLREYVLKDQPTIDLTARFLLRMVREDEFTKRLFTRLFIMCIEQKNVIDDTRGLVVWAT